MSTTQQASDQATPSPARPARIDTRLEVIVIPVSDVDRARRFYEGLGWRLDADFSGPADYRIVQMTPPGSPCSVIFGTGVTSAAPGSGQGLVLVIDDLEAARADLIAHGAAVTEIFHDGFHPAGTIGRVPGPDPERRSYYTFAAFRDPDGNEWLLQEIRTRLPGRVESYEGADDAATLTQLLRETETRHGAYEATAPTHHWSEWYAAYIVAREHGRTADEAAGEAARHVDRARR
ncbi:MAG TPA: VOC family protein [Kofleriaceae bacterium]|jgi:catechol 2,3-dioxygenase-like lactoylglutathione lyase family enzyme|nr:VOC family protein [Kofleriaceae bacterium]